MAGMVVVGVDGSEQSLQALRLAAREARCRSARLRIVLVYEPARAREVDLTAAVVATGAWSQAERGGGLIAEAHRHDDEARAEVRRHADGRLQQHMRDAGVDLRDLDVEPLAVGNRHPAEALLHAAADAELLVVGSRGHGGFAGLLLGSVSQQCVQHATCPVLVARRPATFAGQPA